MKLNKPQKLAVKLERHLKRMNCDDRCYAVEALKHFVREGNFGNTKQEVRALISKYAEKKAKKPKARKGYPSFDTRPFDTNPYGITDFYNKSIPPWDESLGEFSWRLE